MTYAASVATAAVSTARTFTVRSFMNGYLYHNTATVRYRCGCQFENQEDEVVPAECPIHREPGVHMAGSPIKKA